jgi:hypothetical protein
LRTRMARRRRRESCGFIVRVFLALFCNHIRASSSSEWLRLIIISTISECMFGGNRR